MSLYDVKCEACGHTQVDFEQSITVGFPTKCPACRRKKLVRDYSRPCELVIQDGTPKTVGQAAERNQKAWGKELSDIKAQKIIGEKEFARRTAPPPFWRKNSKKPLDLSKVKDATRYIQTGKKD